jgi:CDP-diacylglycerol--glycerol-3-phosphate 3-phosphatidyltransferase
MNLPNKITLCRIAMIPLFIALYYITAIPHNFLYATIVFALAAFTDFLDGYIARKYHLVTDLGKFLDPIADKVLVLVAMTIIIADPKSTNLFAQIGEIGIILGGIGVSIILAREMAVSSLRMIAAKNGKVLAADTSGKIKTFFTDVAIIVMLFAGDFLTIAPAFGKIVDVIGIVFFGISVFLTIFSGISYLVKNKEVFKE